MLNWLVRWFRHDNENEQIRELNKKTELIANTLIKTQNELHQLKLLEKTNLTNETSYRDKVAEVSFIDPKGTKEIAIIAAGGILKDTQRINLNENEAKELLNILNKYFGENE